MDAPSPDTMSPALRAVRDRLQSPDAGIPVLPALAQQVISLAGDGETPAWKLAGVIQKDQVLTAKILGLANSAFCGSLQRVSSVMDAILRMGTASARNLVMTVCFTSRTYDPTIYGPSGRTLMDHGLGTAYLGRLVAERAGLAPDAAFLVGLLHDLGKLVILKLAFDQKKKGQGVTPDELEWLIQTTHAAIGARVLDRWQLPEEIVAPVAWHHDPDQAIEPHTRAAAVAWLANRLSHRYGFGCSPEPDADLLSDPITIGLGIDEAWLATADEKAPGLFQVARDVLAA